MSRGRPVFTSVGLLEYLIAVGWLFGGSKFR